MATTNEGKIVLPQQHVKKGRGVPGYKGADIKVVNAEGKTVGKGATDKSKSKSDSK